MNLTTIIFGGKKPDRKEHMLGGFDVCEVPKQTIEHTGAMEVRIVVTNLWEGNERARGGEGRGDKKCPVSIWVLALWV